MIVLKRFNSTVRRFKKGDEVQKPETPEAIAELAPHTFDNLVERKFLGDPSEALQPALPSPAAVGRRK